MLDDSTADDAWSSFLDEDLAGALNSRNSNSCSSSSSAGLEVGCGVGLSSDGGARRESMFRRAPRRWCTSVREDSGGGEGEGEVDVRDRSSSRRTLLLGVWLVGLKLGLGLGLGLVGGWVV